MTPDAGRDREQGGLMTDSQEQIRFDYVIEQGKIREFAAAAQSDLPEHQGPDATVPPTFLMSRAFWAPDGFGRPNVGFDRKRVLHAEEEFVFHGPPPKAGDRLRVTSYVGDRYEKEGARSGKMRFAVIVTEFRDADGRLVAEDRSTVVETAAAPVSGS